MLSTILGFCGFGVGVSAGLVIGYYLFIYFQPTDVKVSFNSFKITSSFSFLELLTCFRYVHFMLYVFLLCLVIVCLFDRVRNELRIRVVVYSDCIDLDLVKIG